MSVHHVVCHDCEFEELVGDAVDARRISNIHAAAHAHDVDHANIEPEEGQS